MYWYTYALIFFFSLIYLCKAMLSYYFLIHVTLYSCQWHYVWLIYIYHVLFVSLYHCSTKVMRINKVEVECDTNAPLLSDDSQANQPRAWQELRRKRYAQEHCFTKSREYDTNVSRERCVHDTKVTLIWHRKSTFESTKMEQVDQQLNKRALYLSAISVRANTISICAL